MSHYPYESLCLSKKGEFAELFNAGSLTKLQFYAKVRNVHAIDVAAKSEKVTDRLLNQETTRHRLSLAQSSTMMLGASRILNYQAEKVLEEAMGLQKASDPTRRPIQKKKKKDKKTKTQPDPTLLDDIFTEPADPGIPDFTHNTVQNLDEITIREDDVIPLVPLEEQPDWFPPLSPHGLDHALRGWINGSLFFLDETSANNDTDPPIGPPAPVEGPHEPTPPVISDLPEDERSTVSVTPMVPAVPGTPKRKATSPRVSDTPSKKPRQQIPADDEPDVPPIQQDPVEAPVEAPVEPVILPPRSPLSSNLSIDTLIEVTPTRRRRPRRLPVDRKNTKLSTALMQRWQRDPLFQTNPFVPADLHLQPNLFVAPSTQLASRSAWGKQLLANYHSMVMEPIPRDYQHYPNVTTDGVIRIDPRDHTGDVSEGVSGTSQNVQEGSQVPPETSGSVIPPAEEPSVTVPEPERPIDVVPTADEPSGAVPEPEIPVDVVPSPDRRRLPKNVREIIKDFGESAGPSSSSASSGRSLDRDSTTLDTEVAGRLEFLWAEMPVVDFKDLCPVETTARQKAAQIFAVLLVYENQNDIELCQDIPYGRIVIKQISKSP